MKATETQSHGVVFQHAEFQCLGGIDPMVANAPSSRRCQERGFLEFHYSAPYAAGGEATVATIELRCRTHHLYEAELDFGTSVRHRGHGRHETRTSTADDH